MKPKIEIPVGTRFERWTVTGPPERKVTENERKYYFPVLCDCGEKGKVQTRYLLNGKSKSCGCLSVEMFRGRSLKHGEKNTRLYNIWANMRNRCRNPNVPCYSHYGGRGISISEEWNEFIPFKTWALSSGYQDNLTIDRIDVNGNYEPTNCRWVGWNAQNDNKVKTQRIEIYGETKTLKEWSRDERCVVSYDRLHDRISKSVPPEIALTIPSRRTGFNR